jgi:hypothetical protein
MLKSGKKRARRKMRSPKYRQKVYELNKKRFIPGILVALRKDSKLLIQQRVYTATLSRLTHDDSEDSVTINYQFKNKSLHNWDAGMYVRDQRMCFKVEDVSYDDGGLEIVLKMKGVSDLMSYKDFMILEKPKRRRLI